MKNKKGFTVIELLIVVALAAILVGMTVSIGFRAVKDAGYTGAVNKLIAEISYVKQLAARENRYVLFEFDADGNSYTIKKQTDIAVADSFDVIDKSGTFLESGNSTKEFYNGSSIANYSFFSNSMGMIYKYTDISAANKIPSAITIPVYFKNNDGSIGESDNVTINPSGGVNVKKTKQF